MYHDKEKTCVGEQRAEDVIAQLEKRKKRNITIVSIVLGSICVIILFFTTFLPLIKKTTFIKRYGQEIYDMVGLVEEGETIKFGKYEQDNDLENGKEDIEWIVLKVEGGRAFVISKYALDNQPYHNLAGEVSWGISSLRAWLNKDFFNEAFSEQEKEMVLLSTPAGYLIQDRVFLWSFDEEPSSILWQDKLRKCMLTTYAANKGALMNNEGYTMWWLIHTTSERAYSGAKDALCITSLGHESDWRVTDSLAVRPVVWIDLKAVSLTK